MQRFGPMLAVVVGLAAGLPSAEAAAPLGLGGGLPDLGLAPAPDPGADAPLLGALGATLGGVVDALTPDAPAVEAAPPAGDPGPLALLGDLLAPLSADPEVPDARAADLADLGGALGVSDVPDAPALVPDVLDDALVLPGMNLPPLDGQTGLGSSGTAQPQLPSRPALPALPRAPGAPGAPGASGSLGSQWLGADMGPRQGLGDQLQAWAEATFGPAFAWYAELPPAMQQLVGGALALLLSGLATAAALVTGFRHLEKDNLLEHTFRAQVLNLIRDHPGLHLREVARRLGLTATNASYHLRVLEKHGFIRSERLNGKRVFVPAAGPDAKQKFLAQALLHRDSRARVLQALVVHPGSNQTNLAALTAQHQGAVSWHLRQLVGAGLVREERSPRECRYQLTALGVELAAGHPALAASPVGAPGAGAPAMAATSTPPAGVVFR